MADKAVAGTSNEKDDPKLQIPNYKRVKNKILRSKMYRKVLQEKKKIEMAKKKERKMMKKKGIPLPPKQEPKTIEKLRVADETLITDKDEEVEIDESMDEMAAHFKRETIPKILITTSCRSKLRTYHFCKELATVLPNASYYHRRNVPIKKMIPQAIEKEFTDMIIINENSKKPNGMVLIHLPEGPTIHFKVSNVQLRNEIKKCDSPTDHRPELILNNFNTRLGHTVGRMLGALFPLDPQFHGRRVVTFHNQRDFIFFRHHRYVFRNEKKVGLAELGPRFTLKTRSVQKGVFDSRYGQYEWFHKRHEMETSRRKFFL
ncbi:ribosome production factor 1-like [Argonauta hians]